MTMADDKIRLAKDRMDVRSIAVPIILSTGLHKAKAEWSPCKALPQSR